MKTKSEFKDAMGYPIPDGCVAMWNMKDEIQGFAFQLASIRRIIRNRIDQDDNMLVHINPSVFDHLSRSIQFVNDVVPYAVCVYCSGADATKPHCSICRGTGLVSKFGYEQRTDAKMRAMREMQIEGLKHEN